MKFDCNHAWIFTRNRPCHCSECGVTRSRWERRNEPTIAELKQELAEWRSGKRRVFWRVRFNQFAFGPTYIDLVRRNNAIKLKGQLTSTQCAKLYRVTVRPKGAKR